MSYPSDVNDTEWNEIEAYFKPEHPGWSRYRALLLSIAKALPVNWRFTTQDAGRKLARLYPLYFSVLTTR